ncbi:MAG: hypothetical protein KC635_25545 [Myxococcales bacterium]|nr:hypothetical protein [Myxococcales bacterium]MCB9733741.1 hypothetical protein [Deltaproteobacteria bacterium]
MDWNDLSDPRRLERFVATELVSGQLPGRLGVRLVDMGVPPETAHAAIVAVVDEGPERVLARLAPARRRRVAISVALIVVGLGLVVLAATFIDRDYYRWPVFVCTGAGLLSLLWGIARVSR